VSGIERRLPRPESALLRRAGSIPSSWHLPHFQALIRRDAR
jgi:hypothetical protein